MNLLVLIPARKGSRRLPGKNIRLFNGKPLIEWTFITCKQLRMKTNVIVSSDDPEVLSLTKSYGFTVVKRPRRLARSSTQMKEVVAHALSKVSGQYTHVLLLQPTSPLRTAADVQQALRLFKRKRVNSLISVVASDVHPEKLMTLQNGLLQPYVSAAKINANIQDLTVVYKQNGAIYIFGIKEFQLLSGRRGGGIYQNPCAAFLMKKERSVDIDSISEFKLAESLFGVTP